jgi:hypothetical protein
VIMTKAFLYNVRTKFSYFILLFSVYLCVLWDSIHIFHVLHTILIHTQPRTQNVPRNFNFGLKRPAREAQHSLLTCFAIRRFIRLLKTARQLSLF